MKLRPGYRTSEFWFTVVSFIFSGLYLTNILKDNDQKEELITIVTHAVESCMLIGGQLIILYRYVSSRSQIKQQYDKKEVENEQKPIDPSGTTVTKQRSSNTRSRKTNTKRKKQSNNSKKTSGK